MIPPLGKGQLDGFLYSLVRTQPNGMSLSVVSMLAQRGVDPWDEARHLAGLQPAAAVAALCEIVSDLPGEQLSPAAANELATRLIGLLPTARGQAHKAERIEEQGASAAMPRRGWRLLLTPYWLVWALSTLLLFSSVATGRMPSLWPESAAVPLASTADKPAD